MQLIKFGVIALIFVAPVIVKMVKAAGAARDRRRQEQLRQFQVNEAMRTGRPIDPSMLGPAPIAPAAPVASTPQGSPQDRLREMAARRQAQIDALRRQRAQPQVAIQPRPATGYQQTAGESASTAFQQRPGVATGFQQQAPQATGYQQQAPVTTGYSPARSTPPQPARPAARQSRRGQSRQAPERTQAPVQQAFPEPTGAIGGTAHEHEGDITHRLVPDAPSTPPTISKAGLHSPSGARTRKVGIEELRRAIVLREVLGRPTALRDSDAVG